MLPTLYRSIVWHGTRTNTHETQVLANPPISKPKGRPRGKGPPDLKKMGLAAIKGYALELGITDAPKDARKSTAWANHIRTHLQLSRAGDNLVHVSRMSGNAFSLSLSGHTTSFVMLLWITFVCVCLFVLTACKQVTYTCSESKAPAVRNVPPGYVPFLLDHMHSV